MTRTVSKTYGVALTVAAVMALAGCSGDSGAGVVAPPATSTTSDSAGGGLPVLSDTGLGELKLGSSLAEAKALGMVGKPANEFYGDECNQYHGKAGAEYLYFTDDQLVVIVPDPKVRLDTGVGVGDTLEDLHNAYGDRFRTSSGSDLGREYLTAPGAPFTARYRIGIDTGRAFRDSKIIDIDLQSVGLGCYE